MDTMGKIPALLRKIINATSAISAAESKIHRRRSEKRAKREKPPNKIKILRIQIKN